MLEGTAKRPEHKDPSQWWE